MPLLIISIPIMVLATAVAVIPLIVLSHREHKRHVAEAAPLVAASTTGAPARHHPSDKSPVAA